MKSAVDLNARLTSKVITISPVKIYYGFFVLMERWISGKRCLFLTRRNLNGTPLS